MRYEQKIVPHYRSFSRKDKVSVWGSCFAQELGNYLERELYDVTRAPYGIIYNPLTMAMGIERLLAGDLPTADELFEHQGVWHSFMHHGQFSSYDKVVALEKMIRAFQLAQENIKETTLFIFTFGTAALFELADGTVVNNCHRMPSQTFRHRDLSVSEIVERWQRLIPQLSLQAPKADFIFTVSPIPHYRNGAHESRLSKARLLLAIDELLNDCHLSDRLFYFGSYEIMVDELRDYRFYAPDYAHPTPQAVSYIMTRFTETFLDLPSEVPFTKRWHQLRGQLEHRPLTDNPQVLKAYYLKLLGQVEELSKAHPHPYLNQEKERLTALTELLRQENRL